MKPFFKLWTPNMGDVSPFGNTCFACGEIFVEDDNEVTQEIENTNFLLPYYQTPEMYSNNICVCGFTEDMMEEDLDNDHSTHYGHRWCFEKYIKSVEHVICPYVSVKHEWFGNVPVLSMNEKKILLKIDENYEMAHIFAVDREFPINAVWIEKVKRNLNSMQDTVQYLALRSYTKFFDKPINHGLRTRKITEMAFDITSHITNYLDDVDPYPSELCMYRGVKNTYATVFLNYLQVGDLIQTRGFNSQSLKFNSALSFSDNNHLMVLCYPANTKFLPLFHISEYKPEREMLTYPNQQLQFVRKENIIDRNTIINLYYFNVIVSTVNLRDLIVRKKLFITYNYDESYQNFEPTQGTPFGDLFQIQVHSVNDKKKHLCVHRNLPVYDEYYCNLIEETPRLIYDLIREFKIDVYTQKLALLALSKDITLYSGLLAVLHGNDDEICRILDHELDCGYIINQYINEAHLNTWMVNKAIRNGASSVDFLPPSFIPSDVSRMISLYLHRVCDENFPLEKVPPIYLSAKMIIYYCETLIITDKSPRLLETTLPSLDEKFTTDSSVIAALALLIVRIIKHYQKIQSTLIIFKTCNLSKTFLQNISNAFGKEIVAALSNFANETQISMPYELQTPEMVQTLLRIYVANIIDINEILIDVISIQNQLLDAIETKNLLWRLPAIKPPIPFKYFNLESALYNNLINNPFNNNKYSYDVMKEPLFMAVLTDLELSYHGDDNIIEPYFENDVLNDLFKRSIAGRINTFDMKIFIEFRKQINTIRINRKLISFLENHYKPFQSLNPAYSLYYFIE